MFMTANQDIRAAIKTSKVKSWQVAYVLGLQDSNFSKMLRFELPKNEKARILSAINKLASGKATSDDDRRDICYG